MLAPVDGGAGVVGLLHGEVGHEAVRRRAVPVVLPWLEEDVTWAYGLDRAAAALAQSGALRHVDRLAVGMGVPGRPCTGCEVDVDRPQPGGVGGDSDRVEVDRAGEPLARSGASVAVVAGD